MRSRLQQGLYQKQLLSVKTTAVLVQRLCVFVQVLPSGMVVLAEPNPDSLLAALEEAVQHVHHVDPLRQHQQVTCICVMPLIYRNQTSTWSLM